MAALQTYCFAEFDQGLLAAQFPLKKIPGTGVCYALVIEFCRLILKGADMNPADVVVNHFAGDEAHAIAAFMERDPIKLNLFDPNFGIYGSEDVSALAAALWAEYAAAGKHIEKWDLYPMVVGGGVGLGSIAPA